jgi:lysophospholipase L1-like esterase
MQHGAAFMHVPNRYPSILISLFATASFGPLLHCAADEPSRLREPEGTEPAGIQYYGRWDSSDPANPSGSWGPIYLQAKFEGTSVRIKLKDATNTFAYSIDGGPMKVLGPNAASESLLASGLADGVHELEFARRSEGGFGQTIVRGLVLDPGKNLLPPAPRPTRKLEVVGDSISAGYGNEGSGGNTPQNENGFMAFGPQLAGMLGAEWSIVAHSGQGMYRNGCETLPPTAQHMPDEFKLTQHPSVGGPAWDFGAWKPDVLIIALGTNDFADYPPGSCARPTDDAFKGAYADFVTFARGVYPDTEIFALGTFISTSSNQFGACNQDICSVVAAKNAAGDDHIHCIDPGFTSTSGAWLPDGTYYIGDWTHPTVASHTRIATRLRDIIQPIMGW